MAEERALIQQVRDVATERNRLDFRLEQLIRQARVAGVHVNDLASAAGTSPKQIFKILRMPPFEAIDPARYRWYAPDLVLPQPDAGLTIGIGTDPACKPLATFTFDATHPVLLLLDNIRNDGGRDVWPVIAASVTASDARVMIYGPRPHQNWDSPTYFGDWPHDADRLIYDCESRADKISKGRDLRPMLVCLDSYAHNKAALHTMNAVMAFGNVARVYLILRSQRWSTPLAIANSVLAVGGASHHSMLPAFTRNLPNIPTRRDTALLTTPEGIAEIVLPPNAAPQDTRSAGA
ncbi:hypothetical protein [Mycobacterium hubeiense]|uniref:hypothetical protein n=1 Tax=Mycobacterium hubeiense TaxID=1867256 RepID=UPI000C7F453C|nr:hypothetical protein [Mycobacterium sp. QGD 101]